MKVVFVYKYLPVFYFEYDGLRNKCVASYGPIIISEKYGRYSVCAAKKQLHLEYAKQFYRTLFSRPLLCLSTSTRIKLDVDAHARHLVEYTGLSPKELEREKENRAKLIWALSANKTITETEIKQMIETKLNILTQGNNKNEGTIN